MKHHTTFCELVIFVQSEDNISWGSNEFDTESEASEGVAEEEDVSSETKEDVENEKSFVSRKQRIVSRQHKVESCN